MKNKDLIITINALEDINKIKELGIKYIAWPLKGFCVGIPNTFFVEEIPGECLENSYLYINRVLDNNGIDELKKIINKLPKNLRGIIFDDLGVLELVKDLKIEKVLYLSHFNCNTESIKIYLDYVDSVIVSTDITKEEIKKIVDSIPNKLTLFILGYTGVMYSRRLLIDNYSKFHKINKENPLNIDNTGHKFILYENEYGTYFYHEKCFDGLELLDLNAKYYFINSVFLNIEDIEDLLNEKSNIETDKGFLNTETIYKLKGDKE